MQLSEGVEWGLHCCVLLAWLDDQAPVPGKRLAEAHELPAPYLTKQMQALVRAGLVESKSGPRGGFALARPPADITMLDVVDAIEGGRATLFACTEIRQQGLGAAAPSDMFRAPCTIAAAMAAAEDQWRQALSRTTVADIVGGVAAVAPGSAEATQTWFDGIRRR